MREQIERFRELVREKPRMGWVLAAGVGILVAIVLFVRMAGGGDQSPELLATEVTIKFEDTGAEIRMLRGRVEQMIWDRPLPLDAAIGLENPETKKMTGFYTNREDWTRMVEGIAEQRTR